MVNFAPRAVPILALAFLAASCGRKPGFVTPGDAVLTPSSVDLQPDSLPGERATLRFGAPPDGSKGGLPAMEFEVRLLRAKDGPETVLKLVADHEVLEREVYESRGDAFRVVSAGENGFAPPLDLIRFPARAGEAWEWDGKVVYAGISREGHAKVTLERDGDAIRSDVDLAIEADPGRPALARRLSFWFEKGHGVVRRAFGDVSARRPVGESWRP